MTYIINKSNPFDGDDILIEEFSTNGTTHPLSKNLLNESLAADTSLVLFGRGNANYGEGIANSMVNKLENFSGSTEPANPVNGQLWICRVDYILTSEEGWFKWDVLSSTWKSFTVKSGPPTTFVDGEFYYDGDILYRSVNKEDHPLNQTGISLKFKETSDISDPNAVGFKPIIELLVYNANAWVGSSDIYANPIPPMRAETGKIWFDTISNSLKIYVNGEFVGILDDYLSLDGNTMKGTINANQNKIINLPTPTADIDIATKKYVDEETDGLEIDTSGFVFHDGSTAMTADFDTGNFKLINVKTPTLDADGANKLYVDVGIANIEVDTTEFLVKNGSVTLTGTFKGGNHRLTDLAKALDSDLKDAINVEYLNDSLIDNGYIKADGSVSMTAELDLANNFITNLLYPTDDTHASNKEYADDIYDAFLLTTDTAEYISRSGSTTLTGTFNAGGQSITDITTRASAPADVTSVEYVTDLITTTEFVKADGTVAMTDTLELGDNFIINVPTPTDDTHISNLAYVENEIASNSLDVNQFLHTDGSRAMTGNLALGSNKIVDLLEPDDASDLATKEYVDNARFTLADLYVYMEILATYNKRESSNNIFYFGNHRVSDPFGVYNPADSGDGKGEYDLSKFPGLGDFAVFKFTMHIEFENNTPNDEYEYGGRVYISTNPAATSTPTNNNSEIGRVMKYRASDVNIDIDLVSGAVFARLPTDTKVRFASYIKGSNVTRDVGPAKFHIQVVNKDA